MSLAKLLWRVRIFKLSSGKEMKSSRFYYFLVLTSDYFFVLVHKMKRAVNRTISPTKAGALAMLPAYFLT